MGLDDLRCGVVIVWYSGIPRRRGVVDKIVQSEVGYDGNCESFVQDLPGAEWKEVEKKY